MPADRNADDLHDSPAGGPEHPAEDCDEASFAEIDAFERRLADARARLYELEREGWQRRGKGPGVELFDPNDPESSVWFDPYPGDIWLSPRYIERIKAAFADRQEQCR
ncbi:MAG: hypothetical protein BroJett005_30490 [Ignavibacteriota bacterium]|nr:MAG: hypothetical protein BroJett005_30490 [Ignavibacteriota bacterium]